MTAAPESLESVLVRWESDAAVLRRCGERRAADLLERCIADVRASDAEDWMAWISEGEAALQAGRSVAWVRAHFDAWRREGHARETPSHVRSYRACIIPRRANLTDAAARGRAAAARLRESA